jgi:hypothetical protein
MTPQGRPPQQRRSQAATHLRREKSVAADDLTVDVSHGATLRHSTAGLGLDRARQGANRNGPPATVAPQEPTPPPPPRRLAAHSRLTLSRARVRGLADDRRAAKTGRDA